MVTFRDMSTLTQASLALFVDFVSQYTIPTYTCLYICARFLGICAFYSSAALLEIPKKPAILYRKHSPQERKQFALSVEARAEPPQSFPAKYMATRVICLNDGLN